MAMIFSYINLGSGPGFKVFWLEYIICLLHQWVEGHLKMSLLKFSTKGNPNTSTVTLKATYFTFVIYWQIFNCGHTAWFWLKVKSLIFTRLSLDKIKFIRGSKFNSCQRWFSGIACSKKKIYQYICLLCLTWAKL